MTVGELRELIKDLNDDIEIDVSDSGIQAYDQGIEPEDAEARWWEIEKLDMSSEVANDYGQVVLILSDKPVME